ncbi:MAG TPA: carboxypeptidase-like regulatory domain-containing protein [Vicinamibacterales bacterium]|nr:carboxypeptidase-like regulatory domain-containing protein [Vicinamibacterales bacterium]
MFLVLALILAIGAPAYAQGSIFSTLSGTVVDAEGLPIPGANVKIKNNATGQEIDLVSGGDGGFTAPNINSGNYSVVVELAGFRTTTLNSVSVAAGIPTAVKVSMQVGTISENVMVVGESATVVQSQSPAISTNLTGQQIQSLPLTSRNALDSLTSLAGFNTSGTARNSTVSGLPRSAINITLDGMSVQDNYLKTTDGYFARLSPLLDSVEEVTVTTAGNTADATGQGAVQIRFVTKAGTNSWTGTAYEYLRHDALNANSWFRNRDLPPDPKTGKAPKAQLRNYQTGFAQGGPIKQNKAFFFVNYEEQRAPSASTLQRIILTPAAASGVFSYNTAGGVQQQNLLQIAANNGQLATIDPTVGKILGQIQAATGQTGGVTPLNNPLVQQYTWSMPTQSFNPSPTMRVDYEVTKSHRLTGSFNYRHINSTPDTTNNAQLPFPNSLTTGSQQSTRYTTSESLRSTIGDSLFNEFRLGGSGGATLFSPELGSDMWSDTNGYRLNFNAACCGTGAALQNPSLGSGQSSREASTKVVENTTTWLKGKHNMQFGATMVQGDVWLQNQTLVPTAEFDIISGEAADAIFNATTLPGASAADITQAKRLYAMLTGRLSRLTGDSRINAAGDQYNLLGLSRAQGRMREFNVFASDSWRPSASLTVSAGLRYVLANPFYPTNDSYTTLSTAALYGVSGEGNINMPGTLTGARPQFVRYGKGQYAYNPDRNNLAPSAGVAWQVPPSAGIMKWFRGSEEGDVVLRGGWAMAFQRPGLSDFTGVFGDNQGIQVTLQADQTTNTLPILLRNNPTLPAAPSVTLPAAPASITTRGNAFDQNIQMPYTQSWSAGWQRKITRDSAIEVRYVGSRHLNDWDSININEPNITTNNFLNEFRQAQANLQANIAAGRGTTFAYMGPGTNTNPLPIFLAHFNALSAANAGNAAVYSGAQWTNATNLGFLAARNPNPWGFASTVSATGLIGNATFRNNAIAAGLPVNFFVANPDLLGAGTTAGASNLTVNGGGTRAHSMQFEYRKRFSHGFAINPSYTWSLAEVQNRYGFTRPMEWVEQAGQVGNVRHALKANFAVEIPVGKERKFGAGMNGFMDAIVGGWSFDGVFRVQTGEVIDFGNVRLVGMTKSELQKEIKVQSGPGGQIFILPADILDNTVKAFNVSATSATGYSAQGAPSGRYFAPANGPDCIETAPGYGDCGLRSVAVNAPSLMRLDLGISKKFDLPGRFTFEFRGEMLNALNDPYFNPASTAGVPLGFTSTVTAPNGPTAGRTLTANTTGATNVDNYRLTDLLGDNQSRQVQLVWRLRW